jgi:4-alpha-glucanotransferase
LASPLNERRAGLLLHPTSLPGSRSGGCLGSKARRFVDFLKQCGFSVWQMLPLGPTHDDGSPYQCMSVHAGHAALICTDDLIERGWLEAGHRESDTALSQARAGFERSAHEGDRAALARFREQHSAWLDDYALFRAIRNVQGKVSWLDWPAPLRDRDPAALQAFRSAHADEYEQVCFEQFVFFAQWSAVRDYAHQSGIALFGDIPIFVSHDSADIWSHRELFALDDSGRPEVVAGVPPDYFSATGQRWGNPLYRWDRVMAEDFRWWLERLKSQLGLFDILRLDHFRGFEKYWEIPAAADTAIHGRWVEAPGEALFERLRDVYGELPLVAEDLGIITPEVDALRTRFRLPGMKILQFAFGGGADNPYLPHNHVPCSVVYTGTHDNDTTLGWYRQCDDAQRGAVNDYLGYPAEAMPWPLIRAALASVARLAVLPMQDILELGGEHRMNMPGTSGNNWTWQFAWEQVPHELPGRLRRLIDIYGRIRS